LEGKNRCSIQLTRVNTMLKPIAHQKLSTMKCGSTIQEHNITIKALMTKVNRPRVNMLMGNASSLTRGRIHALIKPSTMAIITAHHQGSTVTPSSVKAVMSTASVEIISLVIMTFTILGHIIIYNIY